MKLRITPFNHLTQKYEPSFEYEVTDESIKKMYPRVTWNPDEEERMKNAFFDAIEKDLRNKNLIAEETTVDYFELT